MFNMQEYLVKGRKSILQKEKRSFSSKRHYYRNAVRG